MSLCVSLYNKGKFYVWADSRVSSEVNGQNYVVTDEYQKTRVIGSKVIFASGDVDIVEMALRQITADSTYEDIQTAAREAYTQFVKQHGEDASYMETMHGIEFALILHEIIDGVPNYTQICYADDFKIKHETPHDLQLFAFGAHSESALTHVGKLAQSLPVSAAVSEAFAAVADTIVGGSLYAFAMDGAGVTVSVSRIPDSQEHPKWNGRPFPVTADMEGNVVARSIILTGTVENSEIESGTITGAIIRTAEPGVYPRVEIDPSSIAFGVYSDATSGIQIPAFDGGVSKIIFNAGGNQSVIFNSPTSGFIFNAYGRATIGGNGVKLEPGGDFVRVPSWSSVYSEGDYTSLRDELNALWSALAGKASASHSHSLTLTNHNHGSTTLTPSGGGTFTVS